MEDLKRQIEEKDRVLLKLEIVIGYTSLVAFLALIFIASTIQMESYIRILIITLASIIFAVGIGNAIKIEQIAGYYECEKCHHKYVPDYLSVFWAMHIGRTRYMKCPKCEKRSWQKKRLNQE